MCGGRRATRSAGEPHYNHDVVLDGKAFPDAGATQSDVAEVSPRPRFGSTWSPMKTAMAYDQTTVPFVPVDPDSDMSIVIHVTPTNTDDRWSWRSRCGKRASRCDVSEWISSDTLTE